MWLKWKNITMEEVKYIKLFQGTLVGIMIIVYGKRLQLRLDNYMRCENGKSRK